MSKLPGNGFQSRAPVLPGLGLHSFHNDSPPFAPASQHPSHEPDYMQLDGTAASRPLSPQDHASTVTSPGEGRPSTSSPSNHVQAAPGASGAQPNQRPSATRLPTSSQDDIMSVSRSKRLVSGYMFGPPVDPDTHEPLEALDPSEPSDPSHTTPPSQTRDSTPVSTVSSSPAPSEVGTLESNMERIKLEERNSDLKRRRSSKSMRARDKEIGYDALAGLNDGEADADENAPQASFGTRQYLLGEEGAAGEYRFPKHRLRTKMKDESKIPIVIVACGSFSPPTYLHLRMFEMAKDEVVESQTYEIMAGYYSPVSSYYKKAGLAPAIHRVRMCELAVEHTSTWLMVDPWEAGQPEYTRTAVVLEHFNEMLNVQEGGLVMSDGKRRRYKIMLLAGGDLIESFGEPGVWSEPDLHIILGRFGCLIVERAGSDVWAFLLSHDILYHHRRNVIVIKQLIYNDISSTKVRLFVKRGMSIKYLLPNSVIQYIYDNKLYRAPEELAAIGAGCGKDEEQD